MQSNVGGNEARVKSSTIPSSMDLSDNDLVEEKPKIATSKVSVPSLISVTAVTAEASSMNYTPATVAVPVLQSKPGFVPLRGSELVPVFSGVNNLWGSQVIGSPYQFHCFQYGNVCFPSAASPNLKRKAEASGNSYKPPPMETFFGHMPGGFYQDSVFNTSFVPVQAVFQNPFFPTALRGPPLNYNLSAPLNLEAFKSREMNVSTASQGSQVGTPPGCSFSVSTHKRKVVHPSCSSSFGVTLNSDGHRSAFLGGSDKHELPLLQGHNAPNIRQSDFPTSSETQPVCFSPVNSCTPEDHKEIEVKGWLVLVQKELRNTDVGNLGRIVLPKKDAEANLPPLVAKDGLILQMEDMIFSINWKFKYRYWPNNRSRMYVMENTGDFVKMHSLQTGDFFVVYKEECSGKYIARGKKVTRPSCAEDMEGPIDHARIEEGDSGPDGQIGPEQQSSVQSDTLLDSKAETDTFAAGEPFEFVEDTCGPSQFNLPDLDPDDIL